MEISFSGKRALVTGASRGIGREIAVKLAKYGAEVVAVDRNDQNLKCLKEEIPSIETLTLDLTDWAQTEHLKSIGPIDLLVNNAGLSLLKSIFDITKEDVDDVFAINTKALIQVTQIVTQNLIARHAKGAIVNLSSQASLAGLMHHTVYCASKGAVDAFTRSAAIELGPHNIRINCVNPTAVMTDMGRLVWSDPKVAGTMIDKIPLGRFGEVHDVVDAVLFLLSDKASMITGTCLPIDGGFLAG